MRGSAGSGRRPDLETGRAGWLVVVAGVAAMVVPASSWRVPDANGIPYPAAQAAAGAVALACFAAIRRWRAGAWSRVGPLEALAILAGVASVLGVVTILPTQALRDLIIYLRAGSAFGSGVPVYLDGLVTAIPADRSTYPFLYPPPLLPVFAALAALPRPLVEGAWVAGSLAALVFALRVIGLPWRWALAALAWRPIFEGLWVGNVAIPLLACLAIAIRHPSALVIPPVVKAYSATATLWLVREGRWRSLALGSAGVLVACALTLPLTGLEAWRSWLAGLDWFARSQASLPDLYGIALPRFVGPAAALVIGLVVLAGALVVGGRAGLARLGMATPALSPSVFAHGLLVSLPALGYLRPAALWVAVGAMAFAATAGSWIGPALSVASWFLPVLRRTSAHPGRAGVPDPLDGAAGPWEVTNRA